MVGQIGDGCGSPGFIDEEKHWLTVVSGGVIVGRNQLINQRFPDKSDEWCEGKQLRLRPAQIDSNRFFRRHERRRGEIRSGTTANDIVCQEGVEARIKGSPGREEKFVFLKLDDPV